MVTDRSQSSADVLTIDIGDEVVDIIESFISIHHYRNDKVYNDFVTLVMSSYIDIALAININDAINWNVGRLCEFTRDRRLTMGALVYNSMLRELLECRDFSRVRRFATRVLGDYGTHGIITRVDADISSRICTLEIELW